MTTINQAEASRIVEGWANRGYPKQPKHDGKQPNIHSDWVYGWLGEAVFSLGLSAPDGSGQYHVYDRLREEATETWWGKQLYDLAITDRPTPAGWKNWPPNTAGTHGVRAPFWQSKHENACNALGGSASFQMIPGLSSLWDKFNEQPPQTEGEWLERTRLTYPNETNAVKATLGIVVDPQDPTDPTDPPDNSELIARLSVLNDDLAASMEFMDAAMENLQDIRDEMENIIDHIE